MSFDPRPGRPAGEIRTAIARSLAAHGPATVRQAAHSACVGYDAARYTVSRMVAAGEVLAVGPEQGAPLPPGRSPLVKQYVMACRLPLPEEGRAAAQTTAPTADAWWLDALVVDLNRTEG